MIEIKETDIIYKLDKNAANLKDIQIPSNTTVFDAEDCSNFYDLKGLQKLENLRILILRNSGISSMDLKDIPKTVEIVDLRGCNLSSYANLPERPENPLRVLASFGGERLLNTFPPNVDIEMDGWIGSICSHKKREINMENQKTRD